MGAPDHRAAARTVQAIAYAVLTVSDSRTEATDDSGRLIRALFYGAGHALATYELVRNIPEDVEAAVRRFLQGPASCLVITGGTGAGRRDLTIETVAPLVEKILPGFGELFRHLSYEEIGRELFLSLNTIQFHVKNIYRKLLVNKRVQAIEKARELHLI